MSAAVRAIGSTLIRELLRRKEGFVLLFLAAIILTGAASLSFFNVTGIENYLREISMNITMLFTVFITIGLTARQLPVEVEKKTLYPILSKPCSRWQFLMGKYTGILAASYICLLSFHACCLLVFAFKGITPGLIYAEAVLLQMAGIALLAAMTLVFSTKLSSPGAVIGICLLLYFVFKWFGSNIELFISDKGGMALSLIYTLIPHFEFFDPSQKVVFSQLYDVVGFLDMLFFFGYAAVYSLLFLCGAWLIFRKKNF